MDSVPYLMDDGLYTLDIQEEYYDVILESHE